MSQQSSTLARQRNNARGTVKIKYVNFRNDFQENNLQNGTFYYNLMFTTQLTLWTLAAVAFKVLHQKQPPQKWSGIERVTYIQTSSIPFWL